MELIISYNLGLIDGTQMNRYLIFFTIAFIIIIIHFSQRANDVK